MESRIETYEQITNDNKSEIELLEARLREKNNMLIELENNYVNIEGVRQLQSDVDEKNAIITELEEKLQKVSKNEANCDKEDLQELDDLLEIIGTKENRITELENALRESVQICTEREMILQQEEHKRKVIMEKVRIYSIYIYIYICTYTGCFINYWSLPDSLRTKVSYAKRIRITVRNRFTIQALKPNRGY